MSTYILRRLLLILPTLLGILVINFVLVQAAPGGPVEQMIAILETTIAELQRDLELKQNRVNGTCPQGAFLVEITEEGNILCEEIAIPEPTPPGQLSVRRLC